VLIFNSWTSGGRSGIYAAEKDGSGLRCLTSSFNLDRYQCLRPSPDRRRLLFLAQPPGEERARFFLLDLDSLRLESYERQPRPFDMRWLDDKAFLCVRKEQHWIARMDKAALEELPFLEAFLVIDIAQDGNRILLRRLRGSRSIFVGYIDRGQAVEVVRGEDYEKSHAIVTPSAWSPDGRTIACVGGYEDEVWLVNADGGHPRKLAQGDYFWMSMQWSPTGNHIAYTRTLDSLGPSSERAGVFVTDIAQGHERQVFSVGRGESWCWMPDGFSFIHVMKGAEGVSLVNVGAATGAEETLIGLSAVLTDVAELLVI
jgi:Tol biopolymer transport system component